MKPPQHISASSISSFVECPAKWTLSYDQERKIRTRNGAADAGIIVHGSLERWRDPQAGWAPTWENLLLCFEEACRAEQLTETFEVYKKAFELLKRAYALYQTHPTIPMQFLETISVEFEIRDWQPLGWPIPFKGFIDHVGLVRMNPEAPHEVVLVIEDYKTGAKAKSWSELTESDIQAGSYCAWAIDVLIPHLEAQGLKVVRVALVWTYVAVAEAVVMYPQDFELGLVKDYIANVSRQILTFVDAYNDVEKKLLEKIEAGGNDGADIEEFEGTLAYEIDQFLFNGKYEKPNHYCSYCPRKNRCTTFQRLLDQQDTIDLTSPNTSMEDIWAYRARMAAISKFGEDRRKEVDDLIRAYLDQNRLETIPMGDKELAADAQKKEEHITSVVAEILGTEFIVANASITKDAVEKELARIAVLHGEEVAREKRLELEAKMLRRPGPRIVRERKLRKTETKSKKKEAAA